MNAPQCFRALWRAWRIFLLEWALREIHPLHPDVPCIVRELHYWRSA